MNIQGPDYYAQWLTRLNHLETSRHTLLAAHVASVGYLAKETYEKASTLAASALLAFWWFALTYFILHCFSALARNLFLKVLMLARQLMRIEYATGAVAAGIGYFSDRSGNEKKKERSDFILLGYAPHVFTVAYFLFAFGVLCAQTSIPKAGVSCVITAIIATCWQARVTLSKITRSFAAKDAEDSGPIRQDLS